MSIRSDPLDELAIPDGTHVEEHDLVTDGDVIVGGQSTVEFGVRGYNVIAGERVSFGGHIEAEGDCRLDMWSEVDEDLLVGRDAYLGERVAIDGELKVARNLDIGDDVTIEDGFEANGWIEIRNPMPTIMFLVIYLSHLFRLGEEEAAEHIAEQMSGSDDHDHDPVLLPRGARVNDDVWRVSTPARIGDGCRLHGNVRAQTVDVGETTELYGSLRARGDVTIGEDTEIHGDVTTRNGDVHVAKGAHVWGDISAEDVELHEHAVVEGRIRVSGELTQIRDTLGPEPEMASEPTDSASGGESTETPEEAADQRNEDTTRREEDADLSAETTEWSEEAERVATTDQTQISASERDGDAGSTTEGETEPGEGHPEPVTDDWGGQEPDLDVFLEDVPFSGGDEDEDDLSENGHDDEAEVVSDAD